MDESSNLLNEFGEFGVTPSPKVLEKCLELLQKYGVTSETFVNCWLGFSTTKLDGEGPSLETLIMFDKDVLSKENFAKTKIKSEPLSGSPIIHNITTISQIAEDDELLGCYGTPARKSSVGAKRSTNGLEGTPQNKRLAGLGQAYPVHSPSVFSPSTPGTTSKFSTRNNAGEVVAKYPVGDVTIDWIRSNEQWEPKIQLHGTPESKLTSKYNYMFSRLRDKYDVLEEQITNMSTLLATKLQIDGFESNSKLNSDTYHTVGRICCDATSGSRLNTASLLLEGSLHTSSGKSVSLDVSHLKEFSFFPGQVVAVEGSNPTGRKIAVKAITTPPIVPVFKTDVSLQGPLNVIVACGPFTPSDDLEFAPLVELIQQINSIRPHMAIIMGPFVDVRNKKIETGELDLTYQEQFDMVLKELQTKILNSIQVCIVPSWRDVHHRTVYPTPPFQQENKLSHFHFLSDPCILNVDGVFIALTSTDILFHLSKEEIAAAPPGSDRLGRLVSHLFSQQSFYPLFPPAEEMSIDLEHADDFSKLPFTPHLLLVPSDLRHFIKNVQGCVVVNTERAVKGVSGGTYARLQITGESSSVQIKAEIVRI